MNIGRLVSKILLNFRGCKFSHDILHPNIFGCIKTFLICRSRLRTITIIVTFLFIAISYSDDRISHRDIYGENNSLNRVNIQDSASLKNTAMLYESLNEKFPILAHYVTKTIEGPAIVYNGIVISPNSTNEIIKLKKLTFNEGLDLNLHQDKVANFSFFTLDGDSYDNATSFESEQLNYSGEHISLNFGNIITHPQNNQVSFVFHLRGENDVYNLALVSGRLYLEGWLNNTFYQKIEPSSSLLLNLKDLVTEKHDKFLSLDKVYVNIEKDTQFESFPFRIDMGNSTIDTPGILESNKYYYVEGFVFDDEIISSTYQYKLKDWNFERILSQEFKVKSLRGYEISSNGWDVVDFNIAEDNKTKSTNIKIDSEIQLTFEQLNILDLIQNFNLYLSLKAFGSPKDILFIAVLIFLILMLFPNFKFRKRV